MAHGNSSNARYAKQQCYVMLCFSVKVLEYQNGPGVSRMEENRLCTFAKRAVILEKSSCTLRGRKTDMWKLCACPLRVTTPQGVLLEKQKLGRCQTLEKIGCHYPGGQLPL